MLIAGTPEFMLCMLVMMRMSGFVLLNPILGRRSIPGVARVGFTMVLTLIVFQTQAGVDLEISSPITFGFLMIKEFVLGFALGFILQLYEFIFTSAGAIMDFSMGLSMATVYDPGNRTQNALTGTILQIYFMLLFFAVDGHLALMNIIVRSSDIVPYGQAALGPMATEAVIDVFCNCVVLGLKLAFPLLAIEFVSELAIGVMMKMVPQINVFILSIQLKIIIGITLLMLFLSPIGDYITDRIDEMLKTAEWILTLAVQ